MIGSLVLTAQLVSTEFEKLLSEAELAQYRGDIVFNPLLGAQRIPDRLTVVDGVCPLMTDPDAWDSWIEGGVDIGGAHRGQLGRARRDSGVA